VRTHSQDNGSWRLTWQSAVARQLANVQSPDSKVLYGQCLDTTALQGKRANRETPDSERADRGGPDGKRAECDRAKTERVIDVRRPPVSGGGHRLNRSNSSLPNLHIVHGAPRSSASRCSAIVSNLGELVIEGQGQREAQNHREARLTRPRSSGA
jgi:hypothetical protein